MRGFNFCFLQKTGGRKSQKIPTDPEKGVPAFPVNAFQRLYNKSNLRRDMYLSTVFILSFSYKLQFWSGQRV